MKPRFSIYAEFHDVPAKLAHQQTTITASNVRLACNDGLKELLKKDGIKGRRHQRIKLTIVRVKQDPESITPSTERNTSLQRDTHSGRP